LETLFNIYVFGNFIILLIPLRYQAAFMFVTPEQTAIKSTIL